LTPEKIFGISEMLFEKLHTGVQIEVEECSCHSRKRALGITLDRFGTSRQVPDRYGASRRLETMASRFHAIGGFKQLDEIFCQL
jgi:hypothetical protein